MVILTPRLYFAETLANGWLNWHTMCLTSNHMNPSAILGNNCTHLKDKLHSALPLLRLVQLHFLQMHDSVNYFPNCTRIHVTTYTNFSSHDIPCYIWFSYVTMPTYSSFGIDLPRAEDFSHYTAILYITHTHYHYVCTQTSSHIQHHNTDLWSQLGNVDEFVTYIRY